MPCFSEDAIWHWQFGHVSHPLDFYFCLLQKATRGMKLHDNCRRKASSSWKLAFSLFLMFDLPHSQASGSSDRYTNVTFIWGRWAISEIYYPALFEELLSSEKMIGELVIPEGQPKDACSTDTTFSIPPDSETWIAFVVRGNCTFKDKIKVAARKGASGVIIYDNLSPGRDILALSRKDAGDIIAFMMSSLKGKQILRLTEKGIRVTAVIEVGPVQCFWKIYLCAYCLILTFVAYFLLCCSPGLMVARHEERKVCRAKTEFRKALHSLEVRKLKKGEIDLAEEICVVCLETYKQRELVRILTCRHVFHKRCIDRWLLKRGTCPICSCDILQKNWEKCLWDIWHPIMLILGEDWWFVLVLLYCLMWSLKNYVVIQIWYHSLRENCNWCLAFELYGEL